MDVAEIFAYVRTSLDSDDTELPDTLCGAWLNAAENRIFAALASAERLFSAEFQLNGDDVTQVFDTSVMSYSEMRLVMGPQWELVRIPHAFALERWPLNQYAGSAVQFGMSTHWSVDDENPALVWLWPAPSAPDTYIVHGLVRQAVVDYTTTTNASVLPSRYHPLLAEYVTSRGAELQQNLSVASMKMARFEAELDVLVTNDTRPDIAGINTIGSVELRGPKVPLGRLSWPWEG